MNDAGGPEAILREAGATEERFAPKDARAVANDPDPDHVSDDALALSFAAAHADRLVFVPALGSWLRWDGTRWADDDLLHVFDEARKVCRAAAREVHGKQAAKIASATTIAAVERLARSDRRLVRSAAAFDSDAWALNTPGGLVNLRTGRLRPHRPADLHTKIAGATPGGDCPRWHAFLAEITEGNADLVRYLQRFVGYTLTGSTQDHAFVFLHGPGGNGKSVFLNTIAAVLGDYAVTTMADVFTVGRNDQHPTHLAALRGARLAVVSEVEEGRPWAESRIKALTAGDRISARVMRGDPFEFTPCFKLWIAGNHRPVLRNPDPAMRRRLHLVPLTFVPDRPDPELPELLKAELGGILAWAIERCLLWQQEGLRPPAVVLAAVAEYFADADLVAAWFHERCDRVDIMQTASQSLFSDWSGWARARGEDPGSQKKFSEALERFTVKRRTKTGVVFVGVALRPPDDRWPPAQ